MTAVGTTSVCCAVPSVRNRPSLGADPTAHGIRNETINQRAFINQLPYEGSWGISGSVLGCTAP